MADYILSWWTVLARYVTTIKPTHNQVPLIGEQSDSTTTTQSVLFHVVRNGGTRFAASGEEALYDVTMEAPKIKFVVIIKRHQCWVAVIQGVHRVRNTAVAIT